MNRIIKDSLANSQTKMTAMGLEEFEQSLQTLHTDFNSAIKHMNGLNAIRKKLASTGVVSRSVALESMELISEFTQKTQPIENYTVEPSVDNFEVALETIDKERQSVMQWIRSLIEKIVRITKELFIRVKTYVGDLFAASSNNAASLASTQKLLDMAKKKEQQLAVAQEGYATGSIPMVAPKYLQIDFSKIITETQRLEYLAQNYIKDSSVLLSVQLRHCKYVIEAYNRLLNSPGATLEEFEQTCQNVTKDCEGRLQGFRASSRVFDCIEITETADTGHFIGVLKYRVTITPPGKEDARLGNVTYTTNLNRAQELQDKLTALNEEIVKCAARTKDFFSHNSKNFLDSLNKLNESGLINDGNGGAKSDYIMQVYSFLVHGNLIQVVRGLNVLNTVWKSVHSLNTRLVQEFMRT